MNTYWVFVTKDNLNQYIVTKAETKTNSDLFQKWVNDEAYCFGSLQAVGAGMAMKKAHDKLCVYKNESVTYRD